MLPFSNAAVPSVEITAGRIVVVLPEEEATADATAGERN